MGHQINFYMTNEDEQKFLGFLRSDPNVCIFRIWSDTPNLKSISDLPERGELCWFKVAIWHGGISPEPKLKYIPRQQHYIIDPLPNEIIEFSRCCMNNSRLDNGRLWVEFNDWVSSFPQETVNKSESFRKWYNRLASWIKRNSERNKAGFYVMPGAARFVHGLNYHNG